MVQETVKGPVTFEEGWAFMQAGINTLTEILEGNKTLYFAPDRYMMLYTKIYDLCVQKPPYDYSEQLYEGYKGAMDQYLNSTVLPSLNEKHGEFLLIELGKRWTNHKIMIRWLSRFFHYLDRYFISRRSLESLYDAGISRFRDSIYDVTQLRVRGAILDLIEQEREGKQIDRALLKNVLSIYIEIGKHPANSYTDDFENHMLSKTSEYYSRKAMKWIEEDSCPEYMLKSEESLRKEKERVANYLHSDTEPKLTEAVQKELLVAYMTQLLEKEHSGCLILLQKDKMEDLSRMYRLFGKISKGLEPIAVIFKQHIIAEGTAFVKQAEDAMGNKAENTTGGSFEIVLVRKLIDLHDKYILCVKECYLDHPLFHKALKEAFEVFCNKSVGPITSAEILASFCDNFLKKGGTEKLSDEAIEDTVDKVVQLLVYISDKDLFAEFYRKKLSRRLLFDKSGNDEHERLILSKLKQQCGAQYTSKMEGMVTDLTLARDHQSEFNEYVSNNRDAKGTDLAVTVLTTGFWPTYKFSELNLPEALANCVETFKAFYETKTKHRKLTWIYSLGTCNVQGRFDSKPIELVVTTFQAATLVLFNNAQRLTYSEVRTQLNLGDDDLMRLLHSLSCAKYKILVKDPPSKSISTSDSFEFNSKFTDKMRRIRIPMPPVDERKKVVDDVGKDRRYAVDACIVRIMKSRKVLGHQQLNMECADQLSKMFKPDFKLIKKRIEDLISREYLERDKENPTVYKYLA